MRKLASEVKLLTQMMDTDEIEIHIHLVPKFLCWVFILQVSLSHGVAYPCVYTVNVNPPFLVKTDCCQRQYDMPSNHSEDTPRNKRCILSVYQRENRKHYMYIQAI